MNKLSTSKEKNSFKLKCVCGVGETLVVGNFGIGEIYITIKFSDKRRRDAEVVISKEKLLNKLNTLEDK